MKKTNIIITAVAAIASIFLLWLWYFLGFNEVDSPTDLVVSVAWWAVVIGGAALVARFEKQRCYMIRTMYVAPNCLYNSEYGIAPLASGISAAPAAIARMLEGLEYSFHTEAAPDQSDPSQRVDFRYIVRTDVYKADDGNAGASSNERWEGEVVNVATGQTTPFTSRTELAALLAA